MLVSGRVRQRQSSSAAEFGLKSRRTKKEMEVRRRLLRQVRSDVSGTNVTRRFLVPRAGRAGVVVSPLPEEMLCRSRCIVSRAQHSEMVSYGVGRDRCRNTSGVGDGRGSSLHKHAERMVLRPAAVEFGGLLERERARPTPMMALGLLPVPLPGSSRLGSPRPSSYHILEY